MYSRHRIAASAAVFVLAAVLLFSLISRGRAQGGTPTPPVLPATPYSYNDPLPPHYRTAAVLAMDNTPANNPITDRGATLGRVLFYDKHLSINNQIACASCHIQSEGFSDPDRFSSGVAPPAVTRRNSMGLSNARYYPNGHFFWDERALTLEDQVLRPIQDPVEMGSNLNDLVAELNTIPYYAPLFQDTFGSPTVTSERMSFALAQFVRSMVSYRAKYDVGRQMSPQFSNFTQAEYDGLILFNGRALCSQCHKTDAHVEERPFNIGLDIESTTDLGVAETTGLETDEGKFKVPSLRNVALTAPYMHDGRHATLEEVVTFYDLQVQPHPNLAAELKDTNGNPIRLNLTPYERSALIAFMRTLTDDAMIHDVRFSDPFVGDFTVYAPLVNAR